MPLPTNVATGTVVGTFVDMYGDPISGLIHFTAVPRYLLDAAEDVVLVPHEITVVIGLDGTFAIELPATDDVDLNPTNWTYRVRVDLSRGRSAMVFQMSLPAGATVDITDAAPVSSSVPSGGVSYVMPAVVALTQAQYDALDTPNPNILYIIVPP